MNEEKTGYEAARIQVLEGLEAVRKRPGMYIGSTGERGLRQLVFEVADRAVKEVLAGRAGRVEVTLTSDGGVRVADDGPGVPVRGAEGTGEPDLDTLLTRLNAGAGPGGGRRDVALGHWAAGPAAVNALSSRMTAEVRREGVRWEREYARGTAVTPLTDAGPATGSGTVLTFWPDAEVFGTALLSFDDLADRFRELAFLNRELDIALTDRRGPGEPRSERFHSPGGVREFVAFLDNRDAAPAVTATVAFEGEDPRMAGTVEVALRWRADGEERVRSFANSRPTPRGGTHELGFRDGVAAALDAYARKRLRPAPAEPGLSAGQAWAGLTAVVSVKLDEPEFHGSTLDVLGNTAVRACVAEAVRRHLDAWLEEHPQQAAAVVERLVRGA
ncbi:ATP-binding protein [Kitasatospora sp. MY 5-36]|uniref:ATP-binding protein n=1 Tax=Kitasatospora sp. MY 5-36 TaxID=1678027 RepID=UPI0009EAD01E|nr:ATP-binding protein [Kitasatospora sp. MY 5-36]